MKHEYYGFRLKGIQTLAEIQRLVAMNWPPRCPRIQTQQINAVIARDALRNYDPIAWGANADNPELSPFGSRSQKGG